MDTFLEDSYVGAFEMMDHSIKKVLLHSVHLYFEQLSTCFLYVFSPQINIMQCEHV